MIHDIINIREYIQEIDNLIDREFKGIQKPASESERINYNLVQLVIEGKRRLNIQVNSGSYWCGECKTEHLRKSPFTEYICTPLIKKHAQQLTELSTIIY